MSEEKGPLAPSDATASPTPLPQETGSAGTQTAAPPTAGTAIVQLVGPIEQDQQHVGAVLSAHLDARSPALMALAVAAYRDAESLRAAVMRKWDDAEREKADYRERWHQEATRCAVLEDREKARGRLQRLRGAVLAIGGVVAGAGLSVAGAERAVFNVGGLLFVIGVVVMAVGSPLFGRAE